MRNRGSGKKPSRIPQIGELYDSLLSSLGGVLGVDPFSDRKRFFEEWKRTASIEAKEEFVRQSLQRDKLRDEQRGKVEPPQLYWALEDVLRKKLNLPEIPSSERFPDKVVREPRIEEAEA